MDDEVCKYVGRALDELCVIRRELDEWVAHRRREGGPEPDESWFGGEERFMPWLRTHLTNLARARLARGEELEVLAVLVESDMTPDAACDHFARAVVSQFYYILMEARRPRVLLEAKATIGTLLRQDLPPEHRLLVLYEAFSMLDVDDLHGAGLVSAEELVHAALDTGKLSATDEMQQPSESATERAARLTAVLKANRGWPRLRKQQLRANRLRAGGGQTARPVIRPLVREVHAILLPHFPAPGRDLQDVRNRSRPSGRRRGAGGHVLADYPRHLLAFISLVVASTWPREHQSCTADTVAGLITD